MPHLCLHSPKTFRSGWISPKTPRQMPQINFWWAHGQPLPFDLLFLGCNSPIAFQQHDVTFGHGHFSFLGWPWTADSKYQMRPVHIVPVWYLCGNMRWWWWWSGIIQEYLSDTMLDLLIRLTLIPDTEQPVPRHDSEKGTFFFMWLSSINAYVASG